MSKAEAGRDGYVYIIRSTSGHYKIGRSTDPHKRFRQLTKTQGPYVYTLVNVIRTNDMYEAEREFHQRFEMKRARGEWFDLTEDDLGPLVWAGSYTL
jgi:predicted GIY-YIG superfamily endonuclease